MKPKSPGKPLERTVLEKKIICRNLRWVTSLAKVRPNANRDRGFSIDYLLSGWAIGYRRIDNS